MMQNFRFSGFNGAVGVADVYFPVGFFNFWCATILAYRHPQKIILPSPFSRKKARDMADSPDTLFTCPIYVNFNPTLMWA